MVPPPAPEAPPPPSRGPGLLWLWILIGIVALAGIGVGASFLITGDGDEADGGDEPPGTAATVSVLAGSCDPASGTAAVDVAIAPPDSSMVTLTGGDGFEQAFGGAGGTTSLAPGQYMWAAEAAQGFSLAGETTGSLTVDHCQESGTPFTVQEQALVAHIPAGIRESCQQVEAEQQLGRASASLLCELEGTTLFYDLFPNTAQMDTYYDSRVREFDIATGSGFCDSAERAENAYVRTRGDQEFEVGRLLCFRDGGDAVFIWTDRRVDVSVEAQRSDPTNDRLYRLWARVEFGPLV
jgi:hypothetical protein